jgi:hypothetical protein
MDMEIKLLWSILKQTNAQSKSRIDLSLENQGTVHSQKWLEMIGLLKGLGHEKSQKESEDRLSRIFLVWGLR